MNQEKTHKFLLLGVAYRNGRHGNTVEKDYGTPDHLAQDAILLFKDKQTNRIWQFILWQDLGRCYSGFCGASWGRLSFKEGMIPFSQKPLKETEIDLEVDASGIPVGCIGRVSSLSPDYLYDCKDIDNSVFCVSYEGGDDYYPSGGYEIKVALEESSRQLTRPLWVFYGESNLGKSSLAHDTGRAVYETDSDSKFPTDLDPYDIIVIGGKYKFTIEDVAKALKTSVTPNRDIVEVGFHKTVNTGGDK